MGSLTIATTESKYKTLEDGRYDAKIMGIVGLGEQKQNPYKGQVKAPIQKVKFIFETVEYNSDEDDKETLCVSRAVAVTCGDRSNLNKILSAVKRTSLSADQCAAIVGSDEQLSGTLGSSLKVDVKTFEKEESVIRYAAGFVELDKDLEFRLEHVKRPTFIFFPTNPDMAVWNSNIKFFIKKEIMNANDSAIFPKELHKQWVLDQEAEEVRKSEKKAAKSNSNSSDLGAIQ